MSKQINRSSSELETFSALLLSVYELARHVSIDEFQSEVLYAIESCISHSSAWWGRASIQNDGPHLHRTHLKNLSERYLSDWKAMREKDITVQKVFDDPGQAVIIRFADSDTPLELKSLGKEHGINQLMCVIAIDPVTQLCEHVALYRSHGEPDFTQSDVDTLTNLMPHLVSATATNQLRTLYNLRESVNHHRVAFAICDKKGVLQMTEPTFTALLLTDFPEWKGPQLPPELYESEYCGENITLSFDRIGGLLLMQARYRDQSDQLSSREKSVAKLMNEGMTYKMIARQLDIAPNTVRHHIRSMYQKLNIHNKTELIRLIQPLLH